MSPRAVKIFFGSIILIYGVLGFLAVNHVTEVSAYNPPIPTTMQEMKDPPPTRVWACHQVVTCEHVDWRYYKPEDVCTYIDDTETAIENPAIETAYGAHCEEIDQKG